MIEIKSLFKSYGNLTVLSDVSLSVPDHEILTVVGPSGAGKTTLLQIAGSLDRPDRGSVAYDGTELTSMSDRKLSAFRNRHIGFIFQFHQLLSEFSAQENVAMPARIGGMSASRAMKRAAELLDMMGLSERLRHKPSQLSGGERQRAAVARALINEPKVVFADEPTGSLDSANRDEICRLISDLRREMGQTFVIVTHDPTIASIADRVVDMADGRIMDIRTNIVASSSMAGSDEEETSIATFEEETGEAREAEG